MDWLFKSQELYIFFITLIGLQIGSFLNVVIYRLPKIMERQWHEQCYDVFPDKIPKPKSIAVFNLSLPRSHCPSCLTPLRIIDNIPILSWLFLKGKCHHCNAVISIRYPLIELLTAVMVGITAYIIPGSYWSLAVVVATFALIALCFIDIDTLLLPDQITLPLMWSGILLALIDVSPVSLQDAVIGAMAGYLSLWLVFQLFKLLTGKEGMGYGDFKLLAALGAWLGWQSLPMLILIASLAGAIGGIFIMRTKQTDKNTPLSFGPYLAVAGWVSLLWGNDIIEWYYSSYIGL